jgi:hypothetical protein
MVNEDVKILSARAGHGANILKLFKDLLKLRRRMENYFSTLENIPFS